MSGRGAKAEDEEDGDDAAASALLDIKTPRLLPLSSEQLEPVPVPLVMITLGMFNSVSSDLFT